MKKVIGLGIALLLAGFSASAAPTRITTLLAAFPTSSSIEIGWIAPNTATPPLTQYDIRVSTVPITTLNWASRTVVTPPPPGAPGSEESVVITGLLPLTKYYVAIKTKDASGGWSMISTVASLTTLEEVPEVPATATVTLAWDPSPSPEVTGYALYVGTGSGAYQTRIDVGNVLQGQVPELERGVTYYFAASAYDGNGVESEFSNEISYTPQ